MSDTSNRGQKRKVKWVVGGINGKVVPPPSTRRNGRRGISGKKHRASKSR